MDLILTWVLERIIRNSMIIILLKNRIQMLLPR